MVVYFLIKSVILKSRIQNRVKDVYDKYKRFDFYGIKTKSSEYVSNDVDFIFVTSNGPEKDARDMIAKNIISESKVCFIKLYK